MGVDGVAPRLEDILRLKTTGLFGVNFYASVLGDPLQPTRIAAAEALAKIGMPASGLPLLLSARFDPDREVRFAAKNTLAAIGEPETILRYAELDIYGTLNRALVSVTTIVLVAFFVALTIRQAGIENAAALGGLLFGAVMGISDGLAGRIKPHRLAIAGGFLGVILTLIGSTLFGQMDIPIVWTTLGILLPVAGALYGWQRVYLVQRLAGLFGGMVIGFLSAGLTLILLGTIS